MTILEFVYYIGLSDNKSITLEQAKRQGFLTVKQSPIFHGETAIVTWAKGHLTELQEPDEYDPNLKVWSLDTLPIIPEKFKYKAKVNKDGKINRQFNIAMTKGSQKGNKWKGTFDTKEQWNKLIANPRFFEDTSKGNIIDVDTSIKYSRSPALFSLSDLQKFFDKKLNLSPTEVQDICQELYEKDKVTTYPRTSSNHISTERFNTLCKDLNKMSSLLSVSNELVNIPEKSDGFFVNNKKSEVHAALTPTEVFPTGPQFQQWSSSKKAVYIEILKRTLAMFLPKYEYEQTTIITEVTPALFKTIGKVPKSPGWKILWKDNDMLFDKDEVEPKTLIKVLNGDPVKPILNPIEKNISKPQPYSLGGLIGAMETAGRDFDDDELRKVMKET